MYLNIKIVTEKNGFNNRTYDAITGYKKSHLLKDRTLKEFRWDIYKILWIKYFFRWDFPMTVDDFEKFENSNYYNLPSTDIEYAEQMGQFIFSKIRLF